MLRTRTDKRGFVLHVLPALLYAVALFIIGASRKNITIPQDFVPQDKLNHFGAFGLFVWLSYRALRFEFPEGTGTTNRLLFASVVASSCTGALLEVWQLLFPYRSSDIWDWVADTLGAIVAAYVAFFWLKWRATRAPSGT